MGIDWVGSMSAMGGMAMPGGWTMSMAWMRMPGQTWLAAAVSFLGMWVVMMGAMMLPSLLPSLRRYRLAGSHGGEVRRCWLTVLVAGGYFFVWTALGVAAFPMGVVLGSMFMDLPALARGVPIAAGMIVLLGGGLQFTAWKARHLAWCRANVGAWANCGTSANCHRLPTGCGAALRYGLRLGLHCCYCCSGLTAILFALGVMDLRAMAVVTAAITLERLAPAGLFVARVIGALAVGSGLLAIARAAGLG